jgi:hypothetical protein
VEQLVLGLAVVAVWAAVVVAAVVWAAECNRRITAQLG